MLEQGDYKRKLNLNGLKGRILFNFFAQRLQENNKISMARQLIRISLPVFWFRFFSKDFHKIAQKSFLRNF